MQGKLSDSESDRRIAHFPSVDRSGFYGVNEISLLHFTGESDLMRHRLLSATVLAILATANVAGSAVPDPEGSDSKSTAFTDAFGFHDPMYIAFGEGQPAGATDKLNFAKFQVSFLFEVVSLHGESPAMAPRRGLCIAYTQTSYWDLESRSQPFFDTSFKPAAFGLYQFLGGTDLSWVERVDIEGGFQHHSNGRDGLESRFMDTLYLNPTFVWRLFDRSRLFFSPRFWTYIGKSKLNEDITDYWSWMDLELTWRADFGLQLETHVIPAKEVTTFDITATYPLSRLWRPLNLYALINYRDGAGETFLQYNHSQSGFIFGIALSR